MQGYNEIELLSIERDDDVHKVLDQLGFDCDYPISYFAAKHRDLTGHVDIGFMVCGEVQCNRKHLTSVFADLTDVLVVSAYSDPSLTKELANLSGLSRSYDNNQESDDYGDEQQAMPANQLEEDWEEVEKQISQLEDIRDMLRGNMYNESGALKTPDEYKQWLKEQTKEKEGR